MPEIVTLSKRQFPEVLFKAVPWVLRLSVPVDAFTISMPKFGLFAAFGSFNGRGQSGEPILPT